jgi:hypothetical protein
MFLWQSSPETSSENSILNVGRVGAGEQHECILLFFAPSAPTDCTLSLIINYTLESDGLTEIRKPLLFDIPVIQPFNTAFEILPALAENTRMPDPFGEEEYPLQVLQNWSLMTSVTRLGSDTLEVKEITVTRSDQDEMSLHISKTVDSSALSDDDQLGTSHLLLILP